MHLKSSKTGRAPYLGLELAMHDPKSQIHLVRQSFKTTIYLPTCVFVNQRKPENLIKQINSIGKIGVNRYICFDQNLYLLTKEDKGLFYILYSILWIPMNYEANDVFHFVQLLSIHKNRICQSLSIEKVIKRGSSDCIEYCICLIWK